MSLGSWNERQINVMKNIPTSGENTIDTLSFTILIWHSVVFLLLDAECALRRRIVR